MKKVKIIAELCQNHNGDPGLFREMTEAAAACGATHVKMQHIFSEELSYRPQFEGGSVANGKQRCIQRPYLPEFERLRKLDLDEQSGAEFVRHCRKLDVVPMTTCFTRSRIPLIRSAGFEVVKIASQDLASYPMVRELAEVFNEIIISTGGSEDEEIKQSAAILHTSGKPFTLLHCVMIYPTSLEDLCLSKMEKLRLLAPSVGFSDHTLVSQNGILASKAALFLGASAIERHFTILEADESKDGPVSINPEQLQELASFAELDKIEQEKVLESEYPDWRSVILGDPDRPLSPTERLNRDYYRGRFASRIPGPSSVGEVIYNWEESTLSARALNSTITDQSEF